MLQDIGIPIASAKLDICHLFCRQTASRWQQEGTFNINELIKAGMELAISNIWQGIGIPTIFWELSHCQKHK